jgi:large-conductance mechanosensitive channel
LKWAAILGLISIIITLIAYLIDITLLVQSYWPAILLVVFLGIPIYAGRDFRSKVGGYLSFKEAFLHALVLLAVGVFIGTVFDYILFNFIDPEIIPILVEVQMENTMKAMESFGGGSTEMMDGMAEGVKKGYTLQGQALGFLWKLVLCALGALIVGGINKKKNKEEEF